MSLGHPLVINRDSSTSALEEAGSRLRSPSPEAREPESLGSPDGGGRWSPPRRPKTSRPLFSPAASFQALQQQQRPSLRGRKNVLAVGVPGEAGGAEGTPVEDPVQNLLAALAVLVSQQGVHERVRCGLAVGQALGQHPPVGADGHRGGQLHQPADRDGEGVRYESAAGRIPGSSLSP